MENLLVERCKRICGSATSECIIDNRKQMACITDMVINKTFGIALTLNHALGKDDVNDVKRFVRMALDNSHELANWVNYLQMAKDLREIFFIERESNEKRREIRYPLPDDYRKYITITTEINGSMLTMELINFSKRGFQALSPALLKEGTVHTFTLITEHSMKKHLTLNATIRYCGAEKDNGYLIGAEIEKVSDSPDFNFFNNVFGFIEELWLTGEPPPSERTSPGHSDD